MTLQPITSSPVVAARVALFGLVLSIAGSIAAVACGAPPDLARSAEPAALAEGIAALGDVFRWGALGWFVAIIGDVIRAWGLYIIFKRVSANGALLGVLWMLLHDAVFGFGLFGLLGASEVAGHVGPFATLAPEQSEPLMMTLLEAHHYGFTIGLMFFSFHLLVNGVLTLRADFMPRVLGVLLLVASVGYLVDAGMAFVMVDPPALVSQLVALPNLVGELAVVVWLVVRARKVPEDAGV